MADTYDDALDPSLMGGLPDWDPGGEDLLFGAGIVATIVDRVSAPARQIESSLHRVTGALGSLAEKRAVWKETMEEGLDRVVPRIEQARTAFADTAKVVGEGLVGAFHSAQQAMEGFATVGSTAMARSFVEWQTALASFQKTLAGLYASFREAMGGMAEELPKAFKVAEAAGGRALFSWRQGLLEGRYGEEEAREILKKRFNLRTEQYRDPVTGRLGENREVQDWWQQSWRVMGKDWVPFEGLRQSFSSDSADRVRQLLGRIERKTGESDKRYLNRIVKERKEALDALSEAIRKRGREWAAALSAPRKTLSRMGGLFKRFRGYLLGLGGILAGWLGFRAIRSFNDLIRDSIDLVSKMEEQLRGLANLTGSDRWAAASLEWARSLRRELGLAVETSLELARSLSRIGIAAASTNVRGLLAAQQAVGVSGEQIVTAVRSPDQFMGLFEQFRGQVPFFALQEILASTGPFDYEERLERLNSLLLRIFGHTLERGKGTLASLRDQISMMGQEIREAIVGRPDDPNSFYSFLRGMVQRIRNFIAENLDNIRTLAGTVGTILRAFWENTVLFFRNSFEILGVNLSDTADKFHAFNQNIILPYTFRIVNLMTQVRLFSERTVEAIRNLFENPVRMERIKDMVAVGAILLGLLSRRPLMMIAGAGMLGYDIPTGEVTSPGQWIQNLTMGVMDLMRPGLTGLWLIAAAVSAVTGNKIGAAIFLGLAAASGARGLLSMVGVDTGLGDITEAGSAADQLEETSKDLAKTLREREALERNYSGEELQEKLRKAGATDEDIRYLRMMQDAAELRLTELRDDEMRWQQQRREYYDATSGQDLDERIAKKVREINAAFGGTGEGIENLTREEFFRRWGEKAAGVVNITSVSNPLEPEDRAVTDAYRAGVAEGLRRAPYANPELAPSGGR